jgi:uncharacterized membrane protein YeiH
MNTEFQVPIYLEWIAVFAWALSGALVGVRSRFDPVGVFVVSLVASFGGGILRDGLFLNRPPVVGTNPIYLAIVFVSVLIILVVGRRVMHLPHFEEIIGYIDAIGTPAFCIVGMQMALNAGYPLAGVALLGVISGTGGGVLRDVLTGRIPTILQPGQFSALVVLLACVLFLVLEFGFNLAPETAGWITVVVFFVVRFLTTRFNWRTVPVDELPLWRERTPPAV